MGKASVLSNEPSFNCSLNTGSSVLLLIRSEAVCTPPTPKHLLSMENFHKYKPSMDQDLIIERVRIDLVGSSWCFTDVSFIMGRMPQRKKKMYILLFIHTHVSSTVEYILWICAV